jgi:hypothetical protein
MYNAKKILEISRRNYHNLSLLLLGTIALASEHIKLAHLEKGIKLRPQTGLRKIIP